MEPPLAIAPPGRTAAPRAAPGWALAGGVLALIFGTMWLIVSIAPGELIQPVDPDLMAVAVFVGTVAALLAAARMMAVRKAKPSARSDNFPLSVAGAMAVTILASTGCLRLGVQAAAFLGTAPQPVIPAAFDVTSTGVNRGSHYLRVRYGAAGRTFSVPVGIGLYDAAQAGDTVTLPVETGRFGIQRALIATRPTVADLHHPA